MNAMNSTLHGLIASLSMIVVSELGDKTFFIAAILAMKNSRLSVFMASMLALAIMTILASLMGVASTIIPKIYIHYTSVALFLIFGFKMLKEGYDMTGSEAKEEMENIESDLERSCECTHQSYTTEDPETGVVKSMPEVTITTKIKRKFLAFVSLAFIKTFTMVLVAEWGDRSQISTMILAARENPYAVTIGALAGHALCTGFAVIGGRFIAQLISVRTGKVSLL